MTDGARRSFSLSGVLGVVLLLLLAWLAAGTEWSLVLDKEAVLRGIAIEGARRSGDACEATLDFSGLPAQPARVSVTRAAGDEPLALEQGRGALTYPAGGESVSLRLTFEGALHKPSHADITLAQRGCQLAPSSLRSMPLLPF